MLPPAGRREPCRLIRVAGAMGERRPRRASLLHRLVFSRQQGDPHRELSRTRRGPRSRRAVGVATPSVVGLETRWIPRIAAARGGSQPLRPRIGRFLGVRQQTAEHGSPLGTFHTREVAGSKPAAPIYEEPAKTTNRSQGGGSGGPVRCGQACSSVSGPPTPFPHPQACLEAWRIGAAAVDLPQRSPCSPALR